MQIQLLVSFRSYLWISISYSKTFHKTVSKDWGQKKEDNWFIVSMTKGNNVTRATVNWANLAGIAVSVYSHTMILVLHLPWCFLHWILEHTHTHTSTHHMNTPHEHIHVHIAKSNIYNNNNNNNNNIPTLLYFILLVFEHVLQIYFSNHCIHLYFKCYLPSQLPLHNHHHSIPLIPLIFASIKVPLHPHTHSCLIPLFLCG